MAPPPPPFDTLGPEDWAAVWRAARRVQRAFDADGGARGASAVTETVMLGEMSSSTHAEVGADVRGAWIELHNRRLREVHWPPMANPRGAHRSYRNNAATSRGLHTHNAHITHITHITENTIMATARRKSRKPARKPRANAKRKSTRRNPSAKSCTSSGRRLRAARAPRAGRGLARCRWDATRSNPSTKARSKSADHVTFDELAKDFGLITYDDAMEKGYFDDDATYGWAHENALRDGASEEEAEEAALAAEMEASNEAHAKWYDATEQAITETLEHGGLAMVTTQRKPKGHSGRAFRPYEFKIVPEKSWQDAAKKIVEVINGVGYFEFGSVAELVRSGPYKSVKDAVLKHYHWLKDYGAVYGDDSPTRIYERAMRY